MTGVSEFLRWTLVLDLIRKIYSSWQSLCPSGSRLTLSNKGRSSSNMWVWAGVNIRYPPQVFMWERNESRRLFSPDTSSFIHVFFIPVSEKEISNFFFFWPRSTHSASWHTWYDPTYETQFYQLILFSQHHFSSSLIPSFLTTFTFKPDLKGQGGLELCKPHLNSLSSGSCMSLNRSFSLSFLIVKRE